MPGNGPVLASMTFVAPLCHCNIITITVCSHWSIYCTCMHTHWQWCVGGSPMNVIICSLHKWLQVLLGSFAVIIIIIIIALLKEFFFEMTAYAVCYSDQTIAFCYGIRNNHCTIGIPRLTKTMVRMCVSPNND